MEKRRILLLSFLMITVALAISNVSPTLNYFEFYRALQEIFIEINEFNIKIEENILNVTVNFTLTNPTGYTGIKVRSLRYIIYFQYGEGTPVKLLEGEFLWNSQEGIPFNAYTNITCSQSHTLTTTSAAASQLIQHLDSEIFWTIQSMTILHTFTGSVIVPLNSVTPHNVIISK
ncbi:MAG: hypothetical protein QW279_13730 [Candidatus Jordarchaeaceae archaeon]